MVITSISDDFFYSHIPENVAEKRDGSHIKMIRYPIT